MRPGEATAGRPDAAQPAVGALTRRTARNAAVRAFAEVLAKLATLSWTVVAARQLDRDEFGAFSFALSLVLLVSALPSWGFDPVLVRRASRDPSQLPRLHTEALTWQTLLAVPVLVVTGFIAVGARPTPEAALVLVLVLVAGLPEIWSDTARATAGARQDQVGVSQALVAQRVVTAVLVIAALLTGFGVVGVAAGFLGGTLAGWALHARAMRRIEVRMRLSLVTRGGLRAMLRGSGYVGLSALVLIVLFRVDVVLLGAIKDDEAVADYTVAYRLLETVLFVAYAVNHSVFPVMSQTGSGGRARLGLERGLAAAGFVYVPFAAVVVVEPQAVLTLLFGADYAGSAPILRWLAPVPLLFTAAYLGQSALIARDLTRPMLVAAVSATVVNVGLNLSLIPTLAGVGAAMATTVSYAVQVLVVTVFLRRGDVGRIRLLRPLYEAAAGALVVAAVLLLLELPILVELPLAGTAYVAAWYCLARRTAPEQVAVVGGLLRRTA